MFTKYIDKIEKELDLSYYNIDSISKLLDAKMT